MADRTVRIVYRITDEGTARVLDELADKARDVGRAGQDAGREAGRGLEQPGRAARRSTEEVVTLERTMHRAGSAARMAFSAALAGAAYGTVRFASASIQAAAQAEALRTRLVGLTGSATAAADAYAEMVEMAVRTPFDLRGVVEAGVTVRAFGDTNRETLTAVADLAAFMGTSMPEAAAAYGRAFAAGAGAADILRERGVLALIATRTGIEDLTKLTLPEFREALMAAMTDPDGQIAGSAERLSRTWAGAVGNVEDALFQAQATTGEFITENQALRDLLNEVSGAIGDVTDRLRKFREENKHVIEQDTAGWVTVLKDAYGGLSDALVTNNPLLQQNVFILGRVGEALAGVGAQYKALKEQGGLNLLGLIRELNDGIAEANRSGNFDDALRAYRQFAEGLAGIRARRPGDTLAGPPLPPDPLLGGFTSAGAFGDVFTGSEAQYVSTYAYAFPSSAPEAGTVGPPVPPDYAAPKLPRAGTVRDAAKAAREAAREAAEMERRVAENLAERERIRLALLDQQVEARRRAIITAEDELRIAQRLGVSSEEQLALAGKLDALERERLLAARNRIEAERQALLQFGPVLDAQAIELATQLDEVDAQLARGPQHVRELQAELAEATNAAERFGLTLNDSLRRAVDGVLNSGGDFDIGEIALNTLRTEASSQIGTLFTEQLLPRIIGRGKQLFQEVGSLFGGPNPQPYEHDAKPLPESDVDITTAAATFGAAVALDLALNAERRGRELFRNTNTLRQTLDRGDVINAMGGGGIVGGLGKFHAENPWFDLLLGGGLFTVFGIGNAPTGGTQRAMALERLFGQAGLPAQSVYSRGENGLRAQFLTNAPNAAAAAAFEQAGFGFNVPGLRQPTIETLTTPIELANGAVLGSHIRSPAQVRNRLLVPLEEAAAERPEVEALRTNEALALGMILTGGLRRGVNVANILTNNLLLTGASEGESRRQLRKLAEQQGVTLAGGIEEAQKLYVEGAFRDDPRTEERNEKVEQFFTTVEGLVELWEEDLPAGIDVSALAVEHFTEQAGLDVDGFNRELERSLEIVGQLEQTLEGGLRTGLNTAAAGFARRDALLAAGGPIHEIIRAGIEARDALEESVVGTIAEGMRVAIVEGVFDAVKDTAAWQALSEAIAGAVQGGDVGAIPELIGDVIGQTLPVLEAALEEYAKFAELASVTPSQLFASETTLREQAEDIRFAQLSPRDQQQRLRDDLGGLDERIAAITADGITPADATVLEPLLRERGELGQEFIAQAGNYAPGSLQHRTLLQAGLDILDTTADLYRDFGISQRDAISSNTSATAENTQALRENTAALRQSGGSVSTVPKDGDLHADFAALLDRHLDAALDKKRPKLRELTRAR